MTPLASQAALYPFLKALTPVIEKLTALSGKPYAWYLTDFLRLEDELLDFKENIIDPVRKFMNGPQKGIFDSASQFVQAQDANFFYLESDDSPQIIKVLADPECFKNNQMQHVKSLVDSLQVKVSLQIETEVNLAKAAALALQERLCGMAEYTALSAEQQEQISQPFNEFTQTVERQKLIAVIRDTLRRFEEADYQRLLTKMTTWAQSVSIQPNDQNDDKKINEPAAGTPRTEFKPEPQIEYIPSRSVRVNFDKAWLADATDVDSYLDAMREALLVEINKGKRIQI
jgi:hypothetical protein